MDIPSLSTFYKRASNGFKYLGLKIFWFCYLFIYFFHSSLRKQNKLLLLLLFCCGCVMRSGFSSWAEPVRFLLSWASAKTGRKQRHKRVDCLTSGKCVFSLSGRASTHRVPSFVTEWRANRKHWRPVRCSPGSSQPSLCTAAGLILFIFNQLCKISTSYQYSFISPKDDSLGFSDSLFIW